MQHAIEVEHLSKIYDLGKVGTGTLSRDIERRFARWMGKEDPFLKLGETNDRSTKGESQLVYSLQDISFAIEQGDSVAIVGSNGAGKSTLLKILSRITSPTTGEIRIRGRVASLLEVGTGFHPELSGRENIFLNGAILGMRKAEIARKLDQIIDFSGVERYIDTPVKRYSSGMYVRLAFSVAAHLEPDILIVDEVLAVGDAEFQKKCLGKMKGVNSEGRTVLFVSHNMAAVRTLCRNAVLLRHGQLVNMATADQIVAQYMGTGENSSTHHVFETPLQAGDVFIHEIGFRAPGKETWDPIVEGQGLELFVRYSIPDGDPARYHFTFHLNNEQGESVFGFSNNRDNVPLQKGSHTLTCHFPQQFFNTGNFYLSMLVVQDKKNLVLHEKDLASFLVIDAPKELGRWLGKEPGFLKPSFRWTSEEVLP